jgi:hypothetical protein
MCGLIDKHAGQSRGIFLPLETRWCVGKYSQESRLGLQVAGNAAVGCTKSMAKFEEGRNCSKHPCEPSQVRGPLFSTILCVYLCLLPGSCLSNANAGRQRTLIKGKMTDRKKSDTLALPDFATLLREEKPCKTAVCALFDT